MPYGTGTTGMAAARGKVADGEPATKLPASGDDAGLCQFHWLRASLLTC